MSKSALSSYLAPLDYFLLSCGVVCSVLHGAVLVCFYEFWYRLVDRISSANDHLQDDVNEICLYYVLLGAGLGIATTAQTACWKIATSRAMLKLRSRVLRGVLQKPIVYFDSHTPAQIFNTMVAESGVVERNLNFRLGVMVDHGCRVIFGLIWCFYRSWQLALLSIGVMVILALVTRSANHIARKYDVLSRDTTKKTENFMTERLLCQRSVKLHDMAAAECGKLKALLDSLLHETTLCEIAQAWARGVGWGTVYLQYAASIWLGAYLRKNNIRSGAVIMGVAACVFNVTASISIFLVLLGNSMVGLEALRQLVVLQGDEQEDSCSTDAPHEPTSVFISEIEFQHVMFVYESQAGPPKSPSANSSKLGSQTFTLQDVSFRLQRGRGTALLGSSGCGKSTILSLLMHLYSPSSGQILMLDEAGACCRAEDLYRQLAYLPQEPDMFTETIAYNVAMGNDAVAPTEIERVCRLVGLHDEIVALPAGYKTVYRQGVLSGGQRQRLGFARVLLRDAPIVILDEPTSALDAVNEEIMNYVILKLLHDPNKVVLLITHRMKLAQLAPQILSIRRRGAISTVVEAALFIPSDSPTAMTPRSIRRMTCKAVSGGMVGEAPRPTQVRWTEVIAAAKRHYVATSLACCGALLITLHQPAYGYILARVTGLYADPHVDDSFVAEGCGLGGYMMLAGLCAGIGCTLQGWFCRVGEAAANAFKMNIFRRALQSDSYFFHRYSIAALVQLLGTESSDVRYLLTPTVGGVITIFTAVLAAFAISLWTQWKLGLVALAVMPLVVLLGLWDDSAVDPRISSVDAERTVVLYETLSAVRTVKLSRLEAHRQKLCDGFFLREFRRSRSQIAVHSVAVGFSVFVWFSVYSLLFWYGTKLLVHGETNFTDIMIILNCTFRCGMAIGIAIGTISTFRSGKNCLVRMLACLDTLQATTPPEDESLQVVASPSCKTQPVRSASFAVNSLTYCVVSKGERVPVLLNVSCQLPPGQVAIIGSSGSGKSTLLTVLAGLDTTMYDGTVRILDSETGGIVSSDPRSRLWRSLIGYVPQQAALLDGTVEENITYCSDMCGKQAAEEDVKWMMECARLACIHDEIMCMEGGYQSVVGHIGRSLSGGQRERIALARALFKRPALLLLDEAYSSLDPATSAAVAENLAKYCKDAGVTTVSVMHDLEAASKYEYVVVLGRRGIARMGRPEEVEAEALAEEQLAEDKPAQCRQTTSSPSSTVAPFSTTVKQLPKLKRSPL